MSNRAGYRLLCLPPLLAGLALLVAVPTRAEREDHALVNGFPGAKVVKRSVGNLESYWIPLGRLFGDGQAEKFQVVEGKWTHVAYSNPAKQSVVEIARHYSQGLIEAGFEIVYDCRDGECGGGWHKTTAVAWDANAPQRYLVGRLPRPEGDVWACVFVRPKASAQAVLHDVDVIEVKPEPRPAAVVRDETDPAWIEHELSERGMAAVYGIDFDAKKLTVLPSSAATLQAIAQLFERDPSRRLMLVVHTDDLAAWKASLQRSRKQASMLVSALVAKHGVPAARLAAEGVGPLAPPPITAGEAEKPGARRVEIILLEPAASPLRATNNPN